MKKIVMSILSLIVVGGSVIGNAYLKTSSNAVDNKQPNIVENETVQSNEDLDVSNEEVEKKEESKVNEQSEKPNNSSSTEIKSNDSISKPSEEQKNEIKTNSNSNQNIDNSEQSVSENKSQSSAENNNNQQNNVSTTFYDSITHGKREFSSESEAFARGTEIQSKELDYVLDYNEQHPEAQIQPDINYFRVYPSAIDENGNYWYYLHFFCQSGENSDNKLKSKF